MFVVYYGELHFFASQKSALRHAEIAGWSSFDLFTTEADALAFALSERD